MTQGSLFGAPQTVPVVRAISLTQPWAWIILHLGKRVENRSRNA